MIIIEGPDSSGKSTLLNKLCQQFNYKPAPKLYAGPPTKLEHLTLTCELLTTLEGNYIFDRFPTISELVYGPIIRNKNLWDQDINSWCRYNDLVINHIIIYCRPPRDVLLNMEGHQLKDYDTKEHIQAIQKKQREIINAYDEVISCYGNVIPYDYTNKGSYDHLITTLKEKYNECK